MTDPDVMVEEKVRGMRETETRQAIERLLDTAPR